MADNMEAIWYSEESIVLRGDTKPYRETLKKMGGSWNPNLKQGGPGWIFKGESEDTVAEFLEDPEKMVEKLKNVKTNSRKVDGPELEALWYSDKSIVVRGEGTRKIKEDLMAIGGKWSPFLKGGKGYIFSGRRESQIEELLGMKVLKNDE